MQSDGISRIIPTSTVRVVSFRGSTCTQVVCHTFVTLTYLWFVISSPRACSFLRFVNWIWINLQIKFSPMRQLVSYADVFWGSSRVPAPRTTGTREEPLRTSVEEAIRQPEEHVIHSHS